MKKEKLLRWGQFGYQLGLLELLWFPDSTEIRQKQAKETRNALFTILDNEGVSYSTLDYHSFCSSVLNHYKGVDFEIYGCLVLGISIIRTNVAKDMNNQKEYAAHARSAIESIPSFFIKEKDVLFDMIQKLDQDGVENIYDVLDAIYTKFFHAEDSISNAVKERQKEEPTYVFISFSSKNREVADALAYYLRNHGIPVWIAPESIPIGRDYADEIYGAISNCSVFILLLTKESQSSVWIPKELDIALSSNKRIYPIHLDDSSIAKGFQFRLINTQIVEAFGQIEKAFLKLTDDLIELFRK